MYRLANLFAVAVCLCVTTACASAGAPAAEPIPTDQRTNIELRAPTAVPGSIEEQAQTQLQAAPQDQSRCASKLTGQVTDANGHILPNVSVDIKSDQAVYNTLTDENGKYGFGGICPGVYRFFVTIPGQEPRLVDAVATLDGAHDLKVDLALE